MWRCLGALAVDRELVPVFVVVLSAWLVVGSMATPASGVDRTETRSACRRFNPLRDVYFGDTHVHTTLSFDANALGVRNTPRDAYRFARGEPVGLQPYDEADRPLRTVRLRRPLDFAAVTDHAALLGELHICNSPRSPGYGSLVCRLYRRWPLLSYLYVNSRAFNVRGPRRYSFCGDEGVRCMTAATSPWNSIREAAEEYYDRSAECRFTTFVAYEWSGGPDGRMIHRNVVFRSHRVPQWPTSYIDEPTPEGLWRALHAHCLDAGIECDVLAIPHNSNLSGGWIFSRADGSEMSREDAVLRAGLEPLVEIMQHKGDSECAAGNAADESCAFEKLPYARMDQRNFPFLWAPPPPPSFVRTGLGLGLREQRRIGINPYKLGIIASTDTHLGTPGLVDEAGYPGHGAGGDTSRLEVPLVPDAFEFNPGGLAAVWAEENSRDAIFEAMRRRETYGTSGPRIAVRFFGGWALDEDACAQPDLVERAYRAGVPMGGDLTGSEASKRGPTFILSAAADPGTTDSPGAPLERLQIVKVWIEGEEVREAVFDLVTDAADGRATDPADCVAPQDGRRTMCAGWSDESFDPSRPALYYARVLEVPTCRWTTHVCNERGIDCNDAVPAGELAACCDPAWPRVVRERAWTSPIWYTPELRDGSGS